MTTTRIVALFIALGAVGSCAAAPDRLTDPVDLLVFAPHPDDEVLGCAGILRQAIAAGRRVKVVVFTNGDGFPGFAARLARKSPEQLQPADFFELARYRRSQSLAAMKVLGGRSEDVLFLGYPDSALQQVYLNRDAAPVRQKFTQKSETYGTAEAAPYTHAAALADVVRLIRRLRPGRICVTHESDRHPDHQAAGRFVKDAVAETGYAGPVDTYLIHGGPQWPWPAGITPESPFEAGSLSGLPWPPMRRVRLSAEEARFKLDAIRAHATHLEGATEGPLAHEKAYLESFVKSEEIFWSPEVSPSRK